MAEWIAYDRLDPIGQQRLDFAAGLIASTIINANPYRKKGAELVKPGALIPDWGAPSPPPKTADEQVAIAEAIVAWYGGRDLRPPERRRH